MFSTEIRTFKPKLKHSYKGYSFNRVVGKTGGIEYLTIKNKLRAINELYKFGCDNIKNFKNHKIRSDSSLDEAIVHIGELIEQKLNVRIVVLSEETLVCKYVERKFDVYNFPLEPFYRLRKTKFFPCVLYALKLLIEKVNTAFTDYDADVWLSFNADEERNYCDPEDFQNKWIINKHYRIIINWLIKQALAVEKRPNYRKFKNEYPEWMNYLKAIYSLEKIPNDLLSYTHAYNLDEGAYNEGYVDINECYYYRWENNDEVNRLSGIDDLLDWSFNERMGNYSSAEFYVYVALDDHKNPYDVLKKRYKEKIKYHKILNVYHECIYGR